MRKIVFLALCLFTIVSVSGCQDANELDEWAYVYTIGIDKGTSDNYRLTLQIPTFKQSSGSSGGGVGGQSSSSESSGQSSQSSEYAVISIDCPSLYVGINMINTSLSRTINVMHAKFIVISEELAKENIGQMADSLIRDRQIRRIAHFIIVKGEASKFIEAFNPVVGTAMSKNQEDMIKQVDISGLAADTTLGDFIENLKATKSQPYASLVAINDFSSLKKSGDKPSGTKTFMNYYAGQLPRKGGNQYEILGTALFDGGKMIGELNGDESRVLLMTQGKFQIASYAIEDPIETKLTDTLKVRQQKKPRIQISFQNNEPIINLTIFLEGDLQAVQSLEDKDDRELIPLLEEKFKAALKEEVDQTIDKCKKLNCDVFGFGNTACRQFFTIQEWEDYHWISNFKNATVNTKIEFIIKRDGTLLKNNPVQSTKGAGK
ncbi:MAG: Ger(x)C family spore germination protein [Firmicutes bacterium HGW-Firmicutes-16]|nr:MAG: Ger(x)C family spore germination protein [Firmicutes bacterium HGW-Firmicutes-16]